MATLDSIRASRSWAADMSDAELLQVVADHAKAPLQNVADAFGVKSGRDRGVGMAGLSSGTDSLQGLGYSALGAVADATGFNGAKNWALRNAARNKSEAELNGRPELERVEDQSMGSALDFGMYQIAKQVPQIAGGLALGAVAPQAAIPAWLARGAASLPSAVGGGGLAAGASFAARKAALETGNTFARNLVGGAGLGSAMGAGSMYQESVDAGDPSPYAALGMAPLYGVTEGIPQAVLGGTLMKTAFNGNLLTRMAKSGGVNAVGGATSELAQNEMEMGFNPNLSDEEKFSRRLNSGVVGGLAEGTIGSAGGLRKARQPLADNEQRDLLGGPSQPEDPQLGLQREQVRRSAEQAEQYQDELTPAPMQSLDQFTMLPAANAAAEMRQSVLDEEESAPLTPELPPAVQVAQQQQEQREAVATQVQAQEDAQQDALRSMFGKYGEPVAAPIPGGTQEVHNWMGTPYYTPVQTRAAVDKQVAAEAKRLEAYGAAPGLADQAENLYATAFRTQQAARAERINDATDPKAQAQAVTPSLFKKQDFTKLVQGAQTPEDIAARVAMEISTETAKGETAIKGDKVALLQSFHEALTGKPTQAPAANDTPAPPAAEVAQQADTDNAPKATPAGVVPASTATESVAPKSEVALNPAPAQLPAKIDGIDANKTVTIGKSDRRKTLAVAEMKARLAGASFEAKRRMLWRLGYTFDTDSTTGETRILPTDGVRTLEEVALEEEAYTGKKVSRAAIGATMAEHGISNDVVTRTMRVDMGDDTSTAELGFEAADAEQEAQGFRVEPTMAKAAGEGLIGNGDGPAKEDRKYAESKVTAMRRAGASADEMAAFTAKEESPARKQALTEAIAKAILGPKEKARTKNGLGLTSEDEARLVAQNEANQAANVARILAHPEAENAALDWDGDNVPYADLPDTLKADWVDTYARRVQTSKGTLASADFDQLLIDQQNIERDYHGYKRTTSEQTTTRALPSGEGRSSVPSRLGGASGEQKRDAPVPDNRRAASRDGEEVTDVVAKPKLDSIPDVTTRAQAKWKQAGQKLEGLTGEELQAFRAKANKLNNKTLVESADAELESRATTKLNADVLGPDTATAAAINRDVTGPGIPNVAINSDAAQFSKAKKGEGSKSAELESDLKKFMRVGAFGNKVTVVQSMADLPAGIQRSVNPTADTQGFVVGNKAYLIADNIAPGKGRAVFLHEIGAHLGLENLMGKEQYAALVSKVKQWAAKADGSQESKLAQAAQQRVTDAGTDATQADSELVAYFIEEAVDAGVDPTATKADTEFGRWFRTLWAAFKKAMHKLGVNPDKLTAQDVVDMAYGAAKIELSEQAEVGSLPGATDREILEFYAANKQTLEPDVRIGTPTKGPGTEPVFWGDGSKLGPYRGIRSSARVVTAEHWGTVPGGTVRPDGNISNSPQAGVATFAVAFAPQELLDVDPRATLLLVVAEHQGGGVWSLGTNGPMKGTSAYDYATDTGGITDLAEDYTRLEGFSNADNMRIYAEMRRRITRAQGGVVPSVFIRRDTGANEGRRNTWSAERVKAKFSKAAKPSQLNDAALTFLEVVKSKGANGLVKMMLTSDLIASANTVLKGLPLKYKAAMDAITVAKTAEERSVADVVEEFSKLSKTAQGTGLMSVNRMLKDSTMAKAWAFEPDWLPKGSVKVDPILAKRFNDPEFSKEARELVKKVFKHGHDSLKAMQAAVVDNTNSEYDALIQELTKAGKLDEAKAETAKKAKSLSDFESLLSARSGWPYAPLRRFGKHVVMAVSARYKQAKDDGNVALMRELESDGDHYFVAFAEGKREALNMLNQIKDSYPGGSSGTFEKLDRADSMMGGRDMLGAMRRLRRMAAESVEDKGLGEKTGARVDDMMRQLYLTLLSETSARKGEIHRKNVAGANEDMMRSFSTQGVATAHFIASLKTNGKIEDHLADMRTEVSASLADRDVKQRYYNEIMARHSLNLEFNPTPGIDRVLATSSIYLLLSNPSYFLMNATQPWMMSHPMMAGKHGYSRSASALVQGYKDMMPILKEAQFDEKSYAKLPSDVREAIEKLANKGVIQIELGQELGQFKSSPDDATRVMSLALNKLRGAAQGVETMNRLSTAIAAYRLEKQRTGSAEEAIDYAAQVINETHGDYTGFNAPRFMRSGIGRVATQFRKFQLIQISMFARLINRAFKGATSEERLAARYALGYNLAHLGAIGGVAAMPGFAAAAWLVGKAFGDDEPDDPRATLTRAVGKDMADLLWGGASQAAGVPVGGRIGAGNMLSPLPYTDIEVSREGYAGILLGLAGPLVGGLMPRAFDGIGMVASGDLWKGAEALAPSGVANISKAVRFQVEGVTQRNGDQAMSPEDISFLDSALQAVGLPTNTIQERTYLAGAKFKADTFYKDRTSSLKKAYSEAFRDNDAGAMREVREEWQSTQVTRRELGFSVQPLSELLKAPQEQRKREAGMVGGVGSNKSTEGFLRTLQ